MFNSFLIGLTIGLLYFGGLYLSTQKLKDAKNPGLLMIMSTLVRMAIMIYGLYYLAQTGYKNILVGFVAIMAIRFVMVFQVRKSS